MSTLPFISHHLYVAAIETEASATVKAAQNEIGLRSMSEPAAGGDARAPLGGGSQSQMADSQGGAVGSDVRAAGNGTPKAVALEVMEGGKATAREAAWASRPVVTQSVAIGANNAGETPGVAGETLGVAGETPGVAGETPGVAGETPGVAGGTIGVAGETPAPLGGSDDGWCVWKPAH